MWNIDVTFALHGTEQDLVFMYKELPWGSWHKGDNLLLAVIEAAMQVAAATFVGGV